MGQAAMMSALGWLVGALWIAWALYWWASSRNVKTTKREESMASRAAHVIPLGFAVWMTAAHRLPGNFLGERFVPHAPLTMMLGVGIVAAGLAFTVWARIRLGRNWSGTVTLKQDHELVRSGPYRFVRHPIYTGILVAFAGSALVRGEWRGALAVVIVFAALWRKLRLEERWLEENFGAAYARYRAEVAALIPFVL